MIPPHVLQDRAFMLQKVRDFFFQRHVLEVDCPHLTLKPSIDLHIDPIPANTSFGHRYLHTSPEYAMKKLLATGIGDIYQLGHVFRDGEKGKSHQPEFTMIEWYRIKKKFLALQEETLELIFLFIPPMPLTRWDYYSLFEKTTGFDFDQVHCLELIDYLSKSAIEVSSSIRNSADKDSLADLIMSTIIEPGFSKEEITLIQNYPPSQASLAKTSNVEGRSVAKRFEIYAGGLELANGYDELTSYTIQNERFDLTLQKRKELGKSLLEKDDSFLQALPKLPECVGVAVGFDRLMMLRHQAEKITQILPFSWDLC